MFSETPPLDHGGSYVPEINTNSLEHNAAQRFTSVSSPDAAQGAGLDIFPAQQEDFIPLETNTNRLMKLWTSCSAKDVIQSVTFTPSMSLPWLPSAPSPHDFVVGPSPTKGLNVKSSQLGTYDGLSHSCYHAAPNPPFPNSATSSANSQHTLTLLPSPDVKRWLIPCTTSTGHSFICGVDGCLRPPIKDKTKAREHIYQHLGIKIAVCSCGKMYSSRAAADRHANTQVKRFACGVCFKRFGRKDYRGLHEKKCTSTRKS
ncbi:hypothetical protein K439DRAFT_457470 [Ramaria rubella]|nr:hypothetical protein K439DRAFT_457470 [Ramaria rubella]